MTRAGCAALLTLVLTLTGATPPGNEIIVEVDGLRSAKGLIQACVTRMPKAFPDCRHDPAARRATLPAAQGGRFVFTGLAPGRYAVALLHDENGNGRADMTLMLPREGFGFSRNPRIRFGPPRFASAAFTVDGVPVRQAITMRYLL